MYTNLYVCNGPCFCCDRIAQMTWEIPVGDVSFAGSVSTKRDGCIMLPRRNAQTIPQVRPEDTWVDPDFAAQYKGLYAFLNDGKYSDGSIRLTGGLVFYVRNGVFTCAVNDNDRNVVAYVIACTWEEMLFKLDDGILKDNLSWQTRKERNLHGKIPF